MSLETAAAIAMSRFLERDEFVRNSYGLGRPMGRNGAEKIKRLESDLKLNRRTGRVSIPRSDVLIEGTFMSGSDFVLFCFSADNRKGKRFGSFYCYVTRITD